MSHKVILDRVIYGFDRDVIDYVAARIPGFVRTPGAKALGVAVDGKLAAGVVYENWNGPNINASIAVTDKRWASRSVLRRLFGYPFNDLGCEVITLLIAASNPASIRLARKLGFKGEAMIRFGAHDGSMLLVLQMERADCKWIGDARGREERRSTEGS